MLKNYIKTAWRNIRANKFYAGINVIGLTIGLVMGIFMLLWVQDELSFDRVNPQAGNVYKIAIVGSNGPTQQILNSIIAPVATSAKSELPQVKDAVRIKYIGEASFKYKDKVFKEDKVAFTDPSYFSVFGFHLIAGNRQQPFADNNSVVITQSVAKRYFGNEDPLGKVITLGTYHEILKVTGIVNDYPANSSVQFDVLVPLARFNQLAYLNGNVNYDGKTRISTMDADWANFSFDTYLLLKPHTDINLLTLQLRKIHERNKPEDAPVPYLAQPLTQLHLYKADGSEGGIETVRTFAVVAVLLLLIACINYINLSTARSMLRAREVSVRKIIGAAKAQLFFQFIAETGLLFTVAALLAVGLIYVLTPAFNSLSGKELVFSFTNYRIWICILITLITTLAASSIYPALLLSSFEPLKALKGKIAGGMGNAGFRRVLVTVQFTVSIVLIIGTLIIGNQLKYIRNKSLGYDKENVLSFWMSNDMVKHYDAVKADLLHQPGVLAVSRSGGDIIDFSGWTGDNDWTGKPAKSNLLFHNIFTDQQFIPFFKMKLMQGRNFTGAVVDSNHFILNETAVKEMGIKNPLGMNMRIQKIRGTVIGVVQDFHYTTMHKKIEPAVFEFNPANSWHVYVKTTGADAQKAIAAVQSQWKQYNNDLPFSYRFLDDTYNTLYKSEQLTGTLFNLFAAVAIFISCMGLLGLATYSAQVKTREIGIRKVLGASVSSIIRLLAREFMVLIFISLLIAVPVAWYAMSRWLQDFAYKVHITGWVFVLAGLGAIAIALITISFQSIRAALANPVKSLRSE